MNTNKNHFLIIFLAICLSLLFSPQKLFSQGERLAVVSDFKGEVKVEHNKISKVVTRVGNRIRNSSVYNEDTISTMPVSMADLVFNDNTHFEIKEDTNLTISTRQITEKERKQKGFIEKVGSAQKDAVRNINLKIGKIWASITPSKSVLTEFETPTGVATVRGTILTIAFIGGVTIIELIEGLLEFNSMDGEAIFQIKPGEKVNISLPEEGKTIVGVDAGKIDIITKIGTARVEVGERAGVSLDASTGNVTVAAESGTIETETNVGTVTIGNGSSLEASLNPGTGEITVTGTKGDVNITTEDGVTKDINKGEGLGTSPDRERGISDFESFMEIAEAFQAEHTNDYGSIVGEEGESSVHQTTIPEEPVAFDLKTEKESSIPTTTEPPVDTITLGP